MRTGLATGRCRARRRALGLLMAAGLVLAAGRASAMHRCGDDVGGKAVACRCGYLLVSSRTLGGSGYALDGTRASGNGRYGFKLVGMGAHVGGGIGNEARANGMDGFWLLGGMHQVVGATTAGNGGDGLVGTVVHTLFAGVHADANGRSGLVASGSGLVVRDSTATANRTFGIWVMGRGVEDGGGNRGADNAALMGPSGHLSEMMSTMMAPLVQCRIGMMGE